MATSGTYAFNPTADDLLTEAWERLGKSPAELTGDVARAARRCLQFLQVEWTNAGLNLWQVERATLALIVGTSDYTLDPSTVDLLDATVTIGTTERLMVPIGRSDYAAIPVKSLQAAPTQYWVERLSVAPVLHVYPTPDSAYTLTYYRLRQPQDISGLGQNLDAPVLWTDALAGGLAARLAVKYAPDRLQLLGPLYADALAKASGENRSRAPLKISIRRRR